MRIFQVYLYIPFSSNQCWISLLEQVQILHTGNKSRYISVYKSITLAQLAYNLALQSVPPSIYFMLPVLRRKSPDDLKLKMQMCAIKWHVQKVAWWLSWCWYWSAMLVTQSDCSSADVDTDELHFPKNPSENPPSKNPVKISGSTLTVG